MPFGPSPSSGSGGLPVLLGAGVPSAGLGAVGQEYINTANRDVYVKQAASPAPAFGTVGWTGASTVTSQAVTMPGSIAAGDLLWMVASAVDNAVTVAPTVTTPAGWTRFINRDIYEAASAGSVYGYWKIAAGADTATLVIDRSSFVHVGCVRYTGANQTTPLNVVSAGTTATGGTTVTTAQVTTTAAQTAVVSYGLVVASPTVPWTVPAGITAQAGDNFAGRVNGAQFGDLAGVGAGVYGAFAWTPSAIGAQPHYGVTFALAGPVGTGSWTRIGSLAA